VGIEGQKEEVSESEEVSKRTPEFSRKIAMLI